MASPREDLIKGGADLNIEVKINGATLGGFTKVISFEVTKELNKMPSAKATIIDYKSNSSEDLILGIQSKYKPGSEIELRAGYDLDYKRLFKGIIVSYNININSANSSELILECTDNAARLTQKRRGATYSNMTDSEIINKILNQQGQSATVSSSSVKHETVIQNDASDWDFINMRAEAMGMVVCVQDGKIEIKKPVVSGAKLDLMYGRDIRKINIKLDSKQQLSGVSASTWDQSAQKLVTVTGKDSMGYDFASSLASAKDLSNVLPDQTFELKTTAPLSKEYMQEWANAKINRSRLAKVRGSVSFQGSELAEPNTTIRLSGLGDSLSGEVFISKVTHNVGNGDWVTNCELGMDSESFSESASNVGSSPAAGLVPKADGAYNAKVKQMDSDPEGDMRILVDIPAIEEGGDGVWARISSGYATGDAGMYFMPEVDDEVVVNFLNGDPRYPIIMGGVHSKVNSSSYEPDNPNTIKAIVTKSQMKIEFEEVKKMITITTPGGNKIVISDDDKSIKITDQTKNKIEMTTSGILLDSPKDITLKAKGKIILDAKSNLEAKSMATVKVDGSTVELKAKSQISVQGATAALKGTGMTEVKGGIVKIN